MMRIVNLGRTGLFVVIRDGVLATIAGRSHWRTIEEVWHAARADKVTLSDFVVHTAA